MKSAPPSATAGVPAGFDYTIVVTNNGPSDNKCGFTVTDALPAGTTFVSASSGCAYGGGTVTCPSSGLTTGASTSWSLALHIASSYADGADLANTAQIGTNATADPDHANDSSTNHTTVTRSADIAIAKTGPAIATAGTDITY